MKNRLAVSDAITAFRDVLEQNGKLTSQQKGVFTTLQQCRTPALGGHVEACPECEQADLVSVQIFPPIRDGPSHIKSYNPHAVQH